MEGSNLGLNNWICSFRSLLGKMDEGINLANFCGLRLQVTH